MPSGAKNYCFTINNPISPDVFPGGLPEDVHYVVWQLEKGAEGTFHIQGYIQLKKRMTLTAVKAKWPIFSTAHLEGAKGSPSQNKAYCTKAETREQGPWELGTIQAGQGSRSDLAEAAKKMLETGNICDVNPCVAVKYASGLLALAAQAPCPRRNDLKVITIIGPTGIGKSFAAHECYPGLYTPYYGNSGLWWDGYIGQDVVMIEEFRGQVPLQKMLQTLDVYPLRVEVKRGAVPARFRLVIVTSNTEPQDWYPDNPMKAGSTRQPERDALARRLGVGTIRYVKAETRADLHKQLALAFRVEGIIAPQVTSWLPALPLVRRPITPPIPACSQTQSPGTPDSPIDRPDDPTLQPPPLKRANAKIWVEPPIDLTGIDEDDC